MKKDIEKKLNKLKLVKKSEFPVLNAVIGFNSKKTPTIKSFISEFRSAIKSSLSQIERTKLKKHIEAIEEYLNEILDTHSVRSVAFFVGDKFFEVLEFEFAIPSKIAVSSTPLVSLVSDQVDSHKKYMVLLADRKKARVFTVSMGEIEDHEEIQGGDVPQNVRANERDFYGRSDKIFRHIEDHLHRHLKLIAEKANEFSKGKKISFVIIGGHHEMFEKIKKHLPKQLSDKILGEFVTELNIPLNKIFLASKKVAEKIEDTTIFEKMQEELRK